MAEYLTGSGVPTGDNCTDEEITWTFNLLKPCKGCVPPEEVDGDLLNVIRKKFGAVYEVGLEMAEAELKQQNSPTSASAWWWTELRGRHPCRDR